MLVAMRQALSQYAASHRHARSAPDGGVVMQVSTHRADFGGGRAVTYNGLHFLIFLKADDPRPRAALMCATTDTVRVWQIECDFDEYSARACALRRDGE